MKNNAVVKTKENITTAFNSWPLHPQTWSKPFCMELPLHVGHSKDIAAPSCGTPVVFAVERMRSHAGDHQLFSAAWSSSAPLDEGISVVTWNFPLELVPITKRSRQGAFSLRQLGPRQTSIFYCIWWIYIIMFLPASLKAFRGTSNA